MTTKKSSVGNKQSSPARVGQKAGTSTGNNGQDTATKSEGGGKEDSTESLLEKLFVDMLKDMYWAEKYLVNALSTMQSAATTDELQDAFEDHKFVTQKHVSRLEKVFKILGKQPEAKKCDAMEGIVEEAKQMIKETTEGTMTRDAALIIAAQKVEHYEIASYGSLVSVALTLGYDDAASILEKTLWDEEDTDKLLTKVAETSVNPMADEEQKEEEPAMA